MEETVLTASLILAMDLSAVPCSAIPTFFKPSMPRPFALMLSTLSVIASTCFGYHGQAHSLIFFEVCIGAHGLTLTSYLSKMRLYPKMLSKATKKGLRPNGYFPLMRQPRNNDKSTLRSGTHG